MDSAATSFILGYHGCDRKLADKVFAGKATLRPSHNDYDWLGDGIYFWEHNARRAFDFAVEVSARSLSPLKKVETPAVVGAVINLQVCLNLLDSRYIALVRRAYIGLRDASEAAGILLPKNSVGNDLLSRKLDCAVLRFLHQTREENGEHPFDTVRAVFVEGEGLYENAGFAAKNHIQVCVRDPACIKGYFRPLDETGRVMSFT